MRKLAAIAFVATLWQVKKSTQARGAGVWDVRRRGQVRVGQVCVCAIPCICACVTG
jgi:hypothetical protein